MTSSAKRAARARASNNARRRGSDFEKRVAGRLGGYVWAGEDGDVEARGYRFECKYRDNLQLDNNGELREFHEQIRRYQALAKNKDKTFLFAYTGGAKQRGDIWISMPIEEFKRLTDLDIERQVVDEFRKRYPDTIDQIAVLAKKTADEMQEIINDGSN